MPSRTVSELRACVLMLKDKGQLEGNIRSITPVRNDRAHFRHVREKILWP